MDHAGFYLIDEAHNVVNVLGKDGRGQPIFYGVGVGERLFQIIGRGHGQYRSKNLLFEDAHIGRNVVKYGGFHKIAMIKSGWPPPTQDQTGSFILPHLNIIQISLPLALINGRAHIYTFVQPRPDLDLFGLINQPFQQGLFDGFHGDNA